MVELHLFMPNNISRIHFSFFKLRAVIVGCETLCDVICEAKAYEYNHKIII